MIIDRRFMAVLGDFRRLFVILGDFHADLPCLSFFQHFFPYFEYREDGIFP